ncbi:MAG: hypothetical protein ACI4U1_04695 [Anaerovoracaceae bacterium]
MTDKEREKKKRNIQPLWLAVLWLMIAGIAAIGATTAWFTFNPVTNVEPMGSTISDGDTTLYIGLSPDGPFGSSCPMPAKVGGDLEPVSTVDLERFYASVMHNRNGISVRYREVTEELEEKVISGTLYLQSLKDNCAVYFYRPGITIDADGQTMAALRLGIRFTTSDGAHTYIFALDDMGGTEDAQSVLTTPEAQKVVSQINGDESAVYVDDPARMLSDFCAALPEDNSRYPLPGNASLGTLQENEVAKLEYWLYLEGCDENCLNEVQDQEIGLWLSFAGVTIN